jgi:hypothetical protein
MKITLPQPPSASETGAAAAALRKADQEVANLQPLWEAARRTKEAASVLTADIERRRAFAEACATFAAKNAGNLVSRKDGKAFGTLTGKGEMRRTLVYPVEGCHGFKTSEYAVYQIEPGIWCERQNKLYSNGINTWIKATE